MARTVAAACFLSGLALGALLLAVFQHRSTELHLNRHHEGDPWAGTKKNEEAEKAAEATRAGVGEAASKTEPREYFFFKELDSF